MSINCGNMKSNISIKQAEINSACFILITFLLILFLLIFAPMFVSSQETIWNDVQVHNNISYFEDSSKKEIESLQTNAHLLDIYQPEDCQSCPVIVYIHGGTWVLGDKGGPSYKAKAFTDNNNIYISMNYRLSPDYVFPAHAYDVARCFAWVKRNIYKYGGDPEKIFLLGHSAGGHLAALIALDKTYLAEFNLLPSDISGVIGLDSAAYHLPSLFTAEPENQYLFSWAFGDNLQDWEDASPVNYVIEGITPPPILLLVAGDRGVSETVNQNFYKLLQYYGYDANIFYFSDEDHVSIDYGLGKDDDPVFPILLNWINGLLK